MGIEWIHRIITHSLLLAAICFIPVGLYQGFESSFGVLAGATWGALNLLLIKNLVQTILVTHIRDYAKLFTNVLLKFPLLYTAGYFLLDSPYLPLYSVIVGSTFVFIAIFLNTLKQMASTTAAVLILLTTSTSLFAALDVEVPEVPNAFTLLHKFYQNSVTGFLHSWENVIFSIIMATVISIVFSMAARRRELIPSGLQNFVEFAVDLLRRFVLEILGPQGEKYVPLLGTLFIYILCMNWLALIPFFKPPTASLNITVALAIVVFVQVQYLNFKNWGFRGFMYHLAGSPKTKLEWGMVPLMFPIELLTQLTRPITLALRLFGNIVGEDILIGAAALFGVFLVSLSSWDIVGGVPMQLPFFFLALLTGLMQALVFTLLSAIYILLSMPHHEDDGHSA